jgi:hypothetical protein
MAAVMPIPARNVRRLMLCKRSLPEGCADSIPTLLIGVGTPRELQGRHAAALAALLVLGRSLWEPMRHSTAPRTTSFSAERRSSVVNAILPGGVNEMAFTTGC